MGGSIALMVTLEQKDQDKSLYYGRRNHTVSASVVCDTFYRSKGLFDDDVLGCGGISLLVKHLQQMNILRKIWHTCGRLMTL